MTCRTGFNSSLFTKFLFSPKQTRVSTRNCSEKTDLYGYKWNSQSPPAFDTVLTVHLYFYLASEDKVRSLYSLGNFKMSKQFDKTNYGSKIYDKEKKEIIEGLVGNTVINGVSSINNINSIIIDRMNDGNSFSLKYTVQKDCTMCGKTESEKMLADFELPRLTKINSTNQCITNKTGSDNYCGCCRKEAKVIKTEYVQVPELLSLGLCSIDDQDKVIENEILIEPEIYMKGKNPEQTRYSLFAVGYTIRNSATADLHIARIKVGDCVYTYCSSDSYGVFKKVEDTEKFPNTLGKQDFLPTFYQAQMAWYKKEDLNTRYAYAMV